MSKIKSVENWGFGINYYEKKLKSIKGFSKIKTVKNLLHIWCNVFVCFVRSDFYNNKFLHIEMHFRQNCRKSKVFSDSNLPWLYYSWLCYTGKDKYLWEVALIQKKGGWGPGVWAHPIRSGLKDKVFSFIR